MKQTFEDCFFRHVINKFGMPTVEEIAQTCSPEAAERCQAYFKGLSEYPESEQKKT